MSDTPQAGSFAHIHLCLWLGLSDTATQIPQKQKHDDLISLYLCEIRILAGSTADQGPSGSKHGLKILRLQQRSDVFSWSWAAVAQG